jgi:hypothetical protein
VLKVPRAAKMYKSIDKIKRTLCPFLSAGISEAISGVLSPRAARLACSADNLPL